MIVYAGKQFWNDFNNWDEGVFQDANRPRDFDKFKLRPWLQSDKWNWRRSNKDTQPKIATFTWLWSWLISWVADWTTVVPQWISIFFKWKATASDFSPYSSIITIHKDNSWNYFTVESFAKAFTNMINYNNKLTSNAFRVNDSWFVECLQTWVYFLNISCQLWYASGHSTINTYKEYAFLYNTDWTVVNQLDIFSRRSTWDPWNVRWTMATALSKWEQLFFASAHTDTSYNAMATYTVSFVQIW